MFPNSGTGEKLKMLKRSHNLFRILLKKLRRKRIRQAKAKERDEEEDRKIQLLQASPTYALKQAELQASEALVAEQAARERERLHQEWLERERIAYIEFKRKKEKDERAQFEKEEQAKRIQKEWETLQKQKQDEIDRREAIDRAKKEREAALLKEATDPLLQQEDGPWQNPAPPPNFGTEQDKRNCPFFLKTGACRFGDRCSRGHPKPPMACTLLIPGMFSHFSIDQCLRDEYDSDISLEYEDSEFYQHFREFYDDVLPEFQNVGRVVQFKVCRNYEPHLRGNVYIQYEREEDALAAFQKFNGRWYAGKQLSCEFTLVTKWKSAICGLYHHNKCPKGKACNFLHVFHNPNNDFFDADHDYSPPRSFRRNAKYCRSPSNSRSRNPHRSRNKSPTRYPSEHSRLEIPPHYRDYSSHSDRRHSRRRLRSSSLSSSPHSHKHRTKTSHKKSRKRKWESYSRSRYTSSLSSSRDSSSSPEKKQNGNREYENKDKSTTVESQRSSSKTVPENQIANKSVSLKQRRSKHRRHKSKGKRRHATPGSSS